MPRASNTRERKAEITHALIRVMATQGYDGASVAEIAKAARLTPGLVHYHFENKHQILLSALDEIFARHEQRLERGLAESDDPVRRLERFIDLHLGVGQEADPEALACWIVLSGEALRDRTVRVELERALERIAARLAVVIRAGVESGAFECDSVDAAAAALLALIQGYYVLAATARAAIPKGSAAASAKRMAKGLLAF